MGSRHRTRGTVWGAHVQPLAGVAWAVPLVSEAWTLTGCFRSADLELACGQASPTVRLGSTPCIPASGIFAWCISCGIGSCVNRSDHTDILAFLWEWAGRKCCGHRFRASVTWAKNISLKSLTTGKWHEGPCPRLGEGEPARLLCVTSSLSSSLPRCPLHRIQMNWDEMFS